MGGLDYVIGLWRGSRFHVLRVYSQKIIKKMAKEMGNRTSSSTCLVVKALDWILEDAERYMQDMYKLIVSYQKKKRKEKKERKKWATRQPLPPSFPIAFFIKGP